VFLSGQPNSSDTQVSYEHFNKWFVGLRAGQIQCFTDVFVIFLYICFWDIKIGMPGKRQVDTVTTASKLWSRNMVHNVSLMIAGLLSQFLADGRRYILELPSYRIHAKWCES